MKNLIQIMGIYVISLVLFTGCAKEATAPTDAMVPMGDLARVDDSFMATIGDATSSYYYVYTPPEYDASKPEGYPTIYMLNGFGGDENYFVGLFNAADASDWLLSRGEIEPRYSCSHQDIPLWEDLFIQIVNIQQWVTAKLTSWTLSHQSMMRSTQMRQLQEDLSADILWAAMAHLA